MNTSVSNKTTKVELINKQSYTLEEKIQHSLFRIKEFYKYQDGKVYVAYSGGKDSTVLLHLVRTLYPDVEAVFTNTTNEYPEILKFVRRTPNVTWLTPKKTFKQIVREDGFPFVSKKTALAVSRLRNPTDKNINVRNLYITGLNRNGQFCARWKLPMKWYPLFDRAVTKFDITSKCCDVLKKNPAKIFERRTGKKAFVGTMADNSNQRENNYIKYGCNVYTHGKEKSRPLSIWTDEDIWNYIHKFNVPYSPIYDDKILNDGSVVKGETNSGCMVCGFGCHLEKGENRFDRLEKRRPKLFKNYMKLENNGVPFSEAFNFINSLQIKRPRKTNA